MRPSQQARLWYVQRISAAVLALCVFVHLAGILYAMQGSISSAEILARTRGNYASAAFYLVFVIAAAVHAPIGLARIAEEWLGWNGPTLEMAMLILCVFLLVCGAAAVWGLVGA
jgi:fumarate reductase subunit C